MCKEFMLAMSLTNDTLTSGKKKNSTDVVFLEERFVAYDGVLGPY